MVTSVKTVLITLVVAIVALVGGALFGQYWRERQQVEAQAADSLARTAVNLQVIQRIRDGKSKEAMDLVRAMNVANAAILMHDHSNRPDSEQTRRKRKVLGDFLKELEESEKERPASEPQDRERAQFITEVRQYVQQSR